MKMPRFLTAVIFSCFPRQVLLYAPNWFARYDHKGRKTALVIDGNSGIA
jgi:hypothetical protein